ncbi:hypothetical protein [Cryobacterium zhongshanensis]|uniref:Uncharacterized protein n=1 Tax=Cryobacterium zhongshanensis TaxID=2928153 RepID=A0AA41QY93_9MICO|nr:hypothetical protein [Cryobacterium zhongshanensis]MCI4659712.1 hypothetical protein [Cryobacterium zhongshanensis]
MNSNQEDEDAMPKNKNRGRRQTWVAQQELPVVPDLGNLSMPRKGNRAAAKYVASVGNLWDRRRVDRKARKNALAQRDARLANPRRKHLDKGVRMQMLRSMRGWSFDHQIKAFVPKSDTRRADGSADANSGSERFEQLLDAIVDVRPATVVLRISGLSQFEAARARGYLTEGSMLVQINPRLDGPVTTQRIIRP